MPGVQAPSCEGGWPQTVSLAASRRKRRRKKSRGEGSGRSTQPPLAHVYIYRIRGLADVVLLLLPAPRGGCGGTIPASVSTCGYGSPRRCSLRSGSARQAEVFYRHCSSLPGQPHTFFLRTAKKKKKKVKEKRTAHCRIRAGEQTHV